MSNDANLSRRQFGWLSGAGLAASALGSLPFFGCSTDGPNETEPDPEPGFCADDDPDLVRPEGWTVESHCKGVDPNYDLLFDDTVVHRFDITIEPDVYEQMMENLTEILSEGGPEDNTEDPMWVPMTLSFNGLVWNDVGMRYKGNSSLRAAWAAGARKLAFRFNFDKFADDTPETENQRFYGFKKMTFSNGFKDTSLIRDKVAADIFRDGGVPAARGAFARIYVDFGEGSTYFGLYTMIEDPSDEMLEVQYGDDSGNLYKPEGDGAQWTHFVEDHFEKKTNEDDSDWSDVISAIDALNGDRGDAGAWRDSLEAAFDVYGFLRCLALNQAMVNWDSYGFMSHNYYVYGDPTDGGRLTWFPWDLNESMLVERRFSEATSVMLDGITDEWPLIRYLLDDDVYRQVYLDELRDALDGAFAVENVTARLEAYHDLIAPYVVGSEGESGWYTFLRSDAEFETSLTDSSDGLIAHVADRHEAVIAALDAEGL